jgi:hypothetical protein
MAPPEPVNAVASGVVGFQLDDPAFGQRSLALDCRGQLQLEGPVMDRLEIGRHGAGFAEGTRLALLECDESPDGTLGPPRRACADTDAVLTGLERDDCVEAAVGEEAHGPGGTIEGRVAKVERRHRYVDLGPLSRAHKQQRGWFLRSCEQLEALMDEQDHALDT